MRGRYAILTAAVALMLLPASASAASLVPLAPAHSFASEPVFATSPPGDPRVFVVERGGGIRIVKDGVLQAKPFLTVPNVDTEVERGLLSMAFPPDYASSGLFYVFTVAAEADGLEPAAQPGQIRILEYHRSATNPDLAEPASARLVFALEHSHGNHNGGQIMFGPEGLLYITLGDNAESSNAQTPLNDYGKVLRIDPRDPDGPGGAAYSVPSSNPYTTLKGAKLPIYAIGLRNPYRASFGPSGELVVADVGEGTWEEVDVGRPTGNPQATTLWGANLGWPECEGFCPSPPPKPGLTEPVFEYPHSGPAEETTGCAILGGYVVRDPRLTGLTGRYLYGDLCRKDLRTLNLGAPGADPQPAGISIPSGALRGFGEDSRGCVYVMTTGNVYRVAPAPDAGAACPPLPPPGPAAADRRPPGLKLKAPRRERLRRVITVAATCDESCTLTAAGWLRTSRPKKSAVCTAGSHRPGCPGPIELSHPASGAPEVPVKLHLRIRKRALLHAKAARRRGKRVKALVRVTATDPSGNSRTLMAGIVLRRGVRRPSAEQISHRYDRLAVIYGPLSVALMLRRQSRDEAVRRLALGAGESVLEVGCGSGANLGRLVAAVGPAGAVTGVDLSSGMLKQAEELRMRNGWKNVTVREQDARALDGGEEFDGVLFSLSYSVLPEPRETLAMVWDRLRPGGRIVIMDAGLPEGLLGRLLRPFASAVSRATVLGDPDSRPWQDLSELGAAEIETTSSHGGLYFVCSALRPA